MQVGNYSGKVSLAYANKVVLAEELAAMRARAVTLISVTKTRAADARKIYRLMHGVASQSGQTPTSHEWFLSSPSLRQHAAFLLVTYATYRQAYANNPDAHGLAFTLTYRYYLDVTAGAPLINPERMVLLVSNGFEIGWKSILTGGSSKFPNDNVKVMRCRHCEIPHLVEAHFLNYNCGCKTNAPARLAA